MTALLRRLPRLLALVVAVLVVGAGPALADPPGPTSYESRVVAIEPPVEGIEVTVLGGDSFLQLVNDGHEVLVPGYDGEEQYLRFDPDGTVWVNQRSATHWQNEDRYAATPVPDGTGPDVPPQWVQVSDTGSWAWHDHRIHWMSPTTLPGQVDTSVAASQEALEWPVTLVVDGTDVVVSGTLTWLPPASPLPTVLAAVVMVGAAVALARRSRARALLVVVGATVVVTGVVGAAQLVGLAPGVTSESLPLLLSVLAAVVLGAGLAARGRGLGLLAAGAAGVPLLVWGVTQWAAVTAPVVPPDSIPDVLARIAVGMALGGGAAAVGIGVWDLFTRPIASAGDDAGDGTSGAGASDAGTAGASDAGTADPSGGPGIAPNPT